MEERQEDIIIDAGVRQVRRWLADNGWTVSEEVGVNPTLRQVEARKDDISIIVGIRSSIYPEDPGFPSPDEKRKLLSMARTKKGVPKLVRVWLNEDLTLKDGNLMWSRV